MTVDLLLIIARLLEPAAKLATARALDPATASHSLGAVLDLGRVAAKEVYAALDWLGRQQGRIEAALARRPGPEEPPLFLWCCRGNFCLGLCQHGPQRDREQDERLVERTGNCSFRFLLIGFSGRALPANSAGIML